MVDTVATTRRNIELDLNDRQTLYLTYGNLMTYRLYVHKVVLAVPFVQWNDEQGRTTYTRQGQDVAGPIRGGVAFYAPTAGGAGLSPIHDWYETSTGRHLYETTAPGSGFDDHGVAFYADMQPLAGLEPVYRWERAGDPSSVVYSTFDLARLGYAKAALSFYGKTLDDQQFYDAANGFVYWVHIKGDSDFGCCGSTNNPTRQTMSREQEFTLTSDPDARGYEATVCSPVCGTGGRVI